MKVVEAWGATYKGKKPGPNQDRVLVGSNIIDESHASYVGSPPLVIAIADGISGDAGGEIAAQLALEVVRGTSVRSTKRAIGLMEAANERILSVARHTRDKHNMCTTVSIVWIHRRQLVWCTRGDTPVYLITDAEAFQVSVPHSGVRGLLTSYLGADARALPESTMVEVLSKETALIRGAAIVSDGISSYVPVSSLLDALADGTREISDIGMELMHNASANGSYDNISFVMARFT